jgi:hypothetical protein
VFVVTCTCADFPTGDELMTRYFGLLVLFLASTTSTASAGMLHYRANGGTSTVWGSIGGTPFGVSTWELTGTGDPASVNYTAGPYPTYWIPMTVTLKLTEGATTHILVLNDPVGQQWSAMSVDYTSVITGSGLGGFGPAPMTLPPAGSTAGGIYGGDPGIFNDLSTPGFFNAGLSSFWGNNTIFSSNLGQLVLTDFLSSNDGYWQITAPPGIPEPGTATLLGFAGVALALARFWRR